MRTLLPLLALASLAACGFGDEGPTVIDGSSPEAFQRTLAAAKDDLGPGDRLKFEAALTEFRAQMFAKADNRQEYQRLIRQGLNGLTAPRVVEEFDRNVDKVRSGTADALFDAKRAIVGRRNGGSGEDAAP